jgi:hypothetical protein
MSDTETWIVERFWPGVGAESVTQAVERLRQATAELRAAGRAVNYLGSAYLPGDEEVLCLFEAASDADVIDANTAAGVPFDRISPVVTIGLTSVEHW